MLSQLGDELRQARVAAGLSQAFVGQGAGCSHTQIGRLERGRAPNASIAGLGRAFSVVGLDLSIRAFPATQPLRDSAHLALLERFRRIVHPTLHLRTEVTLPDRGDRRAWDAVLYGAGEPIGIEAETRLRDAQALERSIQLKQRDAALGRVVLLLAATRWNRAVLRDGAGHLTAAFPLDSSSVLEAVAAAKDPGASGIVLL
jgi:transcriptional regulator with XRE-family HTH domain